MKARVIAAALFMLAAAVQPTLAKQAKLTLLLMCDMYDLGPKNGRGGYAKVAQVVAKERASGRRVFLAHAGDAFSPTLLSGFDQGEHVVELLNTIRPDAFVPGNHEYDFGPEVLRKRLAAARFPVLAANLRDAQGEPLAGVSDTRMLEVDGTKIGVVGLTAQDSAEKSTPGDLVIKDVVGTLRDRAAGLRKDGADLIVAIVHGDREVDRAVIESRAADILLSGDDHDLWIEYNGRTAAAEAKMDGEYVIAVDVSVEIGAENGKRTVAWTPRFRIIDTADVRPEPKVARMVAGYEARLSRELDVPLGTTQAPLDSRNATVRASEAAIGNLFADAILASTHADAALLNGGGFRANRLYPAGHAITRRDVLTELPFSNKTVVLEVTGAQLRQALEFGISNLREPTGRYPQVAGLRLVADRARPAGQRLVSVEIGGDPLDDARVYKLATNDFLMRGGDGFSMLTGAKVLSGDRDGKLIANDVMVHIRRLGTVTPVVDGRITIQ